MGKRLSVLGLVVCAVLSLSAAPASARGAREVTVLSFNIHHAQGTDDVLDLARVARVVTASGADVVGLQEVDRHFSERSDWADQARRLGRLLGYHVVFGANIDDPPPAEGRPRSQYGTAILSRYPILDWDNTLLARSPGEEQRGLLHAELAVRGTRLHVYDTHLSASSQTDRAEQTRQVVDEIGDTAPAVLVGDLNAAPDAPEIATLDAAYTDVWPLTGAGDGATHPARSPEQRIDYVYAVGGVRPVTSWVVSADPTASDHRPVVCRFVVERSGN